MASSVNITRTEAQERSQHISSGSYQVVVDLSGRGPDGNLLASPETTFVSTTTACFSSDDCSTWIDLIADQVFQVSLDGESLDPGVHDGNRMSLELTAGDHELQVVALCRYSRTGEGLHRFIDPLDGKTYLYTQFETADSRRMYACFEQPDLKATFQLSVIAPRDWKVYSNSPTPEPTEVEDGFGRWEFSPTGRIATYITALVAGEFYAKHGIINSIKGEIGADMVCRESMVDYLDFDRMLTTTQNGFDIYEEYFGHEYPFDKYDQLFLPEYNMGAMENAGCVTLRDDYLFRSRVTENEYAQRDNTILHELAHMWFGDLVTMRWWDDLWLNESFAEWASHWCQSEIARRDGGLDAWTMFANRRKRWAYGTDQLPTTHPIAADMIDLETVEQSFDGITYAKGASVLKQLVAYVGEKHFFAGTRAYFTKHAWGNTEFADLLAALQEASGRDLSQFASQWLETSGVNLVRADFQVDEQGNYQGFRILQSAVGEQVLRTHRMALGLYDLADGALALRERIEVDIADEATAVEALNGVTQPDLLILNDQDLDYVKVRLDERSLDTVKTHLVDLADPLARAIVWTSLWDSWRDGEIDSEQYLSIVLDGLRTENDPTAILDQLRQAHLAVTGYSLIDSRPTRRALLTGGLANLLKTAEPGSDKQVAIADALITAIDSPAGADLLTAWLAGDEVPGGLKIDDARRWSILTTLSRLGWISGLEVDNEAERDRTISGAESAAGARAAMADPVAKSTAWQIATTDPDVPNGTHLAICTNFWKYGQENLLADYADRYLEVIRQIADSSGPWEKRGHIARQTVLVHLWPAPVADQAFLDRLSAWMDSRELPGQVKRVLMNNRDEAQRALRVAEFSTAE